MNTKLKDAAEWQELAAALYADARYFMARGMIRMAGVSQREAAHASKRARQAMGLEE